MVSRRFAPGQKKVEVLNALREVEEENRVGAYRTVPHPCAVDKLTQAELIDTSPDVALPKWQMHQTKQLIHSTGRYQTRDFHPSSFPPNRLEVEIEKGLRRPTVAEDIPVDSNYKRHLLLKLARRYHKLGERVLAALGEIPRAQELSAKLRDFEDTLDEVTGDGVKQLMFYL